MRTPRGRALARLGTVHSRPVIPVTLATVQFSRSAKRRSARAEARDSVHKPPAGAGLSKLNSMRVARRLEGSSCDGPDSVDMSSGRSPLRRAPRGRSPGRRSTVDRCPPIRGGLPRKEVIQPQLPLRLPCYDFTPITSPTLDRYLPSGVGPRASGVTGFRGVTGGVYKAREHIHRRVLTGGY